MRLYVDTNIYLDFLLERENREGKGLGDVAAKLFIETVSCKHTIVLSDAVCAEITRYVSPDKATILFAILKKKIERVEQTITDKEQAKLLPTNDAIHIILARKAGVDCVVTRNVTDFRGFIEAFRPEEI